MNRLVLTLLFFILLTACSHRQEPPFVTKVPPTPFWPDTPGIKRLADEQSVRLAYGCAKRSLPFLVIERHELSSSELLAGQEFQHRFAYAVCVSDPSAPMKGILSRKIFFHGKKRPMFKSVSKDVKVNPGKWADVATIKIPKGVKPGQYIFRLIFSIPNSKKITMDLPFAIKNDN